MNVLSALFRRPAWNAANYSRERERRADKRYDALIPVTIGPPGLPPVAGLVINLSLGGAAVRMHEWNTPWLVRLNQNDELWLTGLLDASTPCRVVVVDDDILRIHFSRDDALRRQLLDVIGRIAAPEET